MLTAAIVIAGWIAGYFVLRAILQRKVKQMRSLHEKELTALRESLAASTIGNFEASERMGHITPQNMSALGESLSAFIGQEVQIRAIKKQPISNPLSSPWAREGCILVQNSHDFEVPKIKSPSRQRPIRAKSCGDEVRRKAA